MFNTEMCNVSTLNLDEINHTIISPREITLQSYNYLPLKNYFTITQLSSLEKLLYNNTIIYPWKITLQSCNYLPLKNYITIRQLSSLEKLHYNHTIIYPWKITLQSKNYLLLENYFIITPLSPLGNILYILNQKKKKKNEECIHMTWMPLLPAEVNINIFGKSMGITPDLHLKSTYNI